MSRFRLSVAHRQSASRGTTLIELVVACMLTMIVMLFTAQGYLSNARSQMRLVQWQQAIDQADIAKTWTSSYLQDATVTLTAAAPDALAFSSAGGRCYQLSLAANAQMPGTETLAARSDALSGDAGCANVGSAAAQVVATLLMNSSDGADALFAYKDADGQALTAPVSPGAVAEVDMTLRLSGTADKPLVTRTIALFPSR